MPVTTFLTLILGVLVAGGLTVAGLALLPPAAQPVVMVVLLAAALGLRWLMRGR